MKLTVTLIGQLTKDMVMFYIKQRANKKNHRGALDQVEVKFSKDLSPKEAEHLNKLYDQALAASKKEEFSTDNMPKDLPIVDFPEDEDELKKKRAQESTGRTSVRFESDSIDQISRQWHIIVHINSASWNTWKISDIDENGKKHYFTLDSVKSDNRLEKSQLNALLVAGVTFTITSENDLLKQEKIDRMIESRIKSNIKKLVESDESDKTDGESDTVDEVQSLLTQMLPKTKDFSGEDDHEQEILDLLKKADNLLSDTPEFSVATEQELKTFYALKRKLGEAKVGNESNLHVILPTKLPNKIMQESFSTNKVITLSGMPSSKLSMLNAWAKGEIKEAVKPTSKPTTKMKFFNDTCNLMAKEMGISPKEASNMLDKNPTVFNKMVANAQKNGIQFVESTDQNYDFLIRVSKLDYNVAINILNRNSIKPKTQFNMEDMSFLGFDAIHQSDDDKPALTPDFILQILLNNGIEATLN